MSAQDLKLMNEFRGRAQPLIVQMTGILEEVEGQLPSAARLTEFARIIDLIHQTSRTLGQGADNLMHPIHRIGDYALICRAVAQQTAEITENQTLFDTAVALLMDATEVLNEMVEMKGEGKEDPVRKFLNQKLVERLQWLNYQFRGMIPKSKIPEDKKLNQGDIDDLLKKLGVA
ncbi:MAG: hypothetical protein KF767_15045 [Bdellovibrionaceae bacterium]|nr:hypothetical protein [Pseudobdellovibrionaceae bacterium]